MSVFAQARQTVARLGAGRGAVTFALLLLALLAARLTWGVPLTVDAERALYDVRALVAAPFVEQDPRIALITYTDETIERTGRRSPLDRSVMARVLPMLDQIGVRSIGIDILIDQAQPEDAQLVAAMRRMRVPTFVAFASYAGNGEQVLPFQEQFMRGFLQRVSAGNVRPASIRLTNDPDNVARSWPDHLAGSPPLLVNAMAGGAGRFARYQRSIAYRLPKDEERGVFLKLPIDVLDSDLGAEPFREMLAGRHILIGGDITDTDLFDVPATRLTNRSVTGLEVHAHMLAQRLDGRMPTALDAPVLWLLALAVMVVGAVGGFSEFTGWRLALLLVGTLVVLATVPFLLQRGGFDTQGLPAFGWLLGWTIAYSAAASAARSLVSDQRRFAQRTLGRYLPRSVANEILRNPERLQLRGERKEIYALFSDLEGFTKLTHAITPEQIAMLLNDYLDRLSKVVLEHGGTIDKFVGDAVVAFWGAPIARADDGDRALRAVNAMVEAGESFRRSAPEGIPPIGRTRVGLHRGEAVVGNFGGEGRIQYTALGDAMNTAARLEGANKKLGTRALVSAEAARGMTDPTLRPMGRVAVRGRSTPIQVFEPVVIADPELTRLVGQVDSGNEAALAELEAYAARRREDQALEKLVFRMRSSGPGGYVALD